MSASSHASEADSHACDCAAEMDDEDADDDKDDDDDADEDDTVDEDDDADKDVDASTSSSMDSCASAHAAVSTISAGCPHATNGENPCGIHSEGQCSASDGCSAGCSDDDC